MAYSKTSKRLEKLLLSVVNNNSTSCVFSPSCIFRNPNTEFKFTTRYLESMDIVQDFVGNYSDNIQISFKVSMTEYQSLLDNMQDLECTIKLQPVDPVTTEELIEQDPFILESMVVIMADQTNMNKVASAGTLSDDNVTNGGEVPNTPAKAQAQMTYTCHLIEKGAFALRHVQLNAILTNTSMRDAINWMAQQFGAESNVIIPADNTQVYSNLVIEPMKGIDDLFPCMQSRYGIYAYGLGYYYTDKTLFVYPQFNTDEGSNTAPGIIRILNAPQNSYAGEGCYHLEQDADTLILSNTDKKMLSMNSVGEENGGGTRVSMNADNQRDNSVKIDDKGKVTRDLDSFMTTISLSNKGGSANSKSQNLKFDGQRSNIYVSTSEMAMSNGSIMTCGWNSAYPMFIRPGQIISYEYDDQNGTFTSQKGRIMSCAYLSSLSPGKDASVPLIKFSCQMQMFLDPEKTADDVVQS